MQQGIREEGMRILEQEELPIIEQEEPSQQEGMRINEQARVWKQEKLRKRALFSEEGLFFVKEEREKLFCERKMLKKMMNASRSTDLGLIDSYVYFK